MSIFGREKFSTTFEKTGDLVYLFAKNKIKMNTVLNVGENQSAYVMVNDKITDEFLPGNYTLSVAVLPISARALKLQKKMNDAKSIIKSITADLYIVNKETATFNDINSFKFVVKDKEFGRVETNLNFSCELNVVNPIDFLYALRKLVAVVGRGTSVKLLKEFAQDAIASVVQKANISVRSFMTQKDKTEEEIFEKFVEKMQKIGIEVISFSMNKLNIKKSIAQIFENIPSYTDFENDTVEQDEKAQTGQIVFERVGMQGEGDRSVNATLISSDKKEEINEFLNIDAFENVENKPRREFRINLGDNSVLTSSGIESVQNDIPQQTITDSRNNIFERRREEGSILGGTQTNPSSENQTTNERFNPFGNRDFSDRRNIFERRENSGIQNAENVQTRTCKNCGKVLSLDDEFCSKCGTKVEK